MLSSESLALIRDNLYECIEVAYVDDKDCQLAKDIAGYLIGLHDAIELELLERSYHASND